MSCHVRESAEGYEQEHQNLHESIASFDQDQNPNKSGLDLILNPLDVLLVYLAVHSSGLKYWHQNQMHNPAVESRDNLIFNTFPPLLIPSEEGIRVNR